MSLVFFNARYIPSAERNLPQNISSDMQYGATRPGVEEYPVKTDRNMDEGDFLNYIANRHGVQNYDGERDGLFGATGKNDLQEELTRLKEHPDSMEWRSVLSLTKEDADRVGLNTAVDWQKMLCRTMPRVAAKFNISLNNLVWNAAYHPIDKHGRDHHPHVHVYFYSTDPTEGVAGDEKHTKQAFRNCRSIFTNDIFREDMEPYKIEKTAERDNLRDLVKDFVRHAPSDLLSGVISVLPEKGKLQYGSKYMTKAAKLEVDKVVRQICSMPGVKESYEKLRNVVRQQAEHYYASAEDVEEEMKEWEEDFFHPADRNVYERRVLHNAVLREAAERAKRAEAKSHADEILKEIPKDLKTEIITNISLSTAANEQLPEFKKIFSAFKDATRHEMISRLTSQAVFDAGNRIYDILKEDTDLNDRLVSEVRLDVPTVAGNSFDVSQLDLLSEETDNDIFYYIKVIRDGREIDQKALYKLKLRFVDIALNKRATMLVTEHGADLDFKPLQNVTQCRRLYIKNLPNENTEICARIAAALSAKCPEIAGSLAAEQTEKVVNAILYEAYKRETNSRIIQVYKDVPAFSAAYRDIATADCFKCGNTYSQLPDDLKNAVNYIAAEHLVNADEYALTQIRNTVCRIAASERIVQVMTNDTAVRNAVTDKTAQLRVFCNACNIKNYSELPEDQKQDFLKVMREIFSDNAEISDYIKKSPENAGSACFRGCQDIEHINEQNRRMAQTANMQMFGLMSGALMLFKPRQQAENSEEQKRAEEKERKRKSRRFSERTEEKEETENQSHESIEF